MSDPTVIGTIEKNTRETVRIALDEYRGVQLIDIRVLIEPDKQSSIPIPTKKGVALRVERLPELIAALQAAAEEACRQGLLAEGGTQ